MRIAAALLALSIGTASWAGEGGADARLRELARTCASQLDVESDVGFDRIAQRCPALARALRGSDVARWLPEDWDAADNEFSRGSLLALVTLLDRERVLEPLRPAPGHDELAAAMARVTPGDNDANGPWARFKSWLRAIFEREDGRRDGWLARSLRRLEPSEAVMRVIGYVTLGIVVVLAFVIVAAELRAAGLLTRVGRASRRREGVATDGDALLTWADVERAPPRERPARLLQLVLDGLVRARRLPPARGMTVREILTRAQLPEDAARTRLAVLASTAERTRFGENAGAGADDDDGAALANVVDAGRSLLESLERDPVRT